MFRYLLFIFFITLSLISNAQTACISSQRYKKQVFPRINVTRNIVYEKADKYDPLNLNIPEDIKLDFYEPAGDGVAKRPLVIFFFGGAFEIGDKGDADARAWCDSLAHHGYAAAAVNYRLGFNTASTASCIRAVYRAVQDSRAAIRFMKEKATLYNIDTTQIFVAGESAGAITALHTAYLNTDLKAPGEVHGSLTEWQDLGCLDCTGDFRRHTVAPKGIISLWGAVYSLSYIEPTINVPTCMIHGTADFIVPFNEGRPFTGQFPSTFPWVYGSQKMDARFAATNIYREFYPYQGQGHIFYGLPTGIVTFPNQYWQPIFTQGRNFLYKLLAFQTPTPSGNLSAAFGSTTDYSVPLRAGSSYCWSVTGGTILSYSNSSATARIKWNASGVRKITLLETDYKQLAGAAATLTIGSPAPRMSHGIAKTATPALLKQLTCYPNPSVLGEPISLKISSTTQDFATFTLYDLAGRNILQLSQALSAGENTLQLPTDGLGAGVYIVSMRTSNSQESLKIQVN